MLRNSISYGVFLAIVFIIYWFRPIRSRWFCLLPSNYYFYMTCNPRYVLLLLFSVTSTTYLFAFKYYNFVVGSLECFF